MSAQSFHILVDTCCSPWTVETAQRLTEGVSRTVVTCECGNRRVLTCTNVKARTGHLEVVA